jgi:hypothetical protein
VIYGLTIWRSSDEDLLILDESQHAGQARHGNDPDGDRCVLVDGAVSRE